VVQLRTDDEIFDWFKFITDRSDMAVMLYRTPVSGKVLGWDLMASFFLGGVFMATSVTVSAAVIEELGHSRTRAALTMFET